MHNFISQGLQQKHSGQDHRSEDVAPPQEEGPAAYGGRNHDLMAPQYGKNGLARSMQQSIRQRQHASGHNQHDSAHGVESGDAVSDSGTDQPLAAGDDRQELGLGNLQESLDSQFENRYIHRKKRMDAAAMAYGS